MLMYKTTIGKTSWWSLVRNQTNFRNFHPQRGEKPRFFMGFVSFVSGISFKTRKIRSNSAHFKKLARFLL